MSHSISHPTYSPACAPFTPSNSGQRSPPTYYRGCWHVVSRGFLLGYRHFFLHQEQEFTIRKPSSSTRRCCIRLSPIVQYSPLLPPVGVWAVSQSQCGRSTSQSSSLNICTYHGINRLITICISAVLVCFFFNVVKCCAHILLQLCLTFLSPVDLMQHASFVFFHFPFCLLASSCYFWL